jgi:hypothetical protein
MRIGTMRRARGFGAAMLLIEAQTALKCERCFTRGCKLTN